MKKRKLLRGKTCPTCGVTGDEIIQITRGMCGDAYAFWTRKCKSCKGKGKVQ